MDVKADLKKKLDVYFRNYRILGACNPPIAHQALLAKDKIGTMLPCNVIVQEVAPGTVEVAAIDPVASMSAVENPAWPDRDAGAGEARKRSVESVCLVTVKVKG